MMKIMTMLENTINNAIDNINRYVSKRELIKQIKNTKDDAEHEQLLQRLDNEYR